MVQMYFQTVLQALCVVRFPFKPQNHNTLEKHPKVQVRKFKFKFKVIHVIVITTIVQDNKSVSELTFISEVLVYLF